MSNQNDGGPAFPCNDEHGYSGMSLRDWFAGMAMQAMISREIKRSSNGSCDIKWCEVRAEPIPSIVADQAGKIADAMLADRKSQSKNSEESTLRHSIQQLRTEIDCRVQHGASSGGHLEYVLGKLDSILKS